MNSSIAIAPRVPDPGSALALRNASPRPAQEPEGDPRAQLGKEASAAAREEALETLKTSAPRPDINLRELSIRVVPETNQVVIEVIDAETKDVVRQIPPEYALDLLRTLPRQRAAFVDKEG